jgi:hypothetical protein
MEKKNLIEIMYKLPIKTKMWCDLIGEVYYLGVDDTNESNMTITIKGVDNGYYETLTEYGTFYDNWEMSPCILWPSKDHRTWDGWEEVLKVTNYNVGDWVVYCDSLVKIIDIKGDKVYVVDQDGNKGDILIDMIEDKWDIKHSQCGDVLVNTNNGDIVVFDKRINRSYFNNLFWVSKDENYGNISTKTNAICHCDYFRPAEIKDIVEFKERLAKLDMFWDGEKVVKYDIGTILEYKRIPYQVEIDEVLDTYVNVSGGGCFFGAIEKKYLDKYWKFVK